MRHIYVYHLGEVLLVPGACRVQGTGSLVRCSLYLVHACGMWHVACGMWLLVPGACMRHVACGMWHVAPCTWCMHAACGMWHAHAHDMWHGMCVVCMHACALCRRSRTVCAALQSWPPCSNRGMGGSPRRRLSPVRHSPSRRGWRPYRSSGAC